MRNVLPQGAAGVLPQICVSEAYVIFQGDALPYVGHPVECPGPFS